MSSVRTVHAGGSRFYVADNAPDIKVPGVTSIISMLGKPFLQKWAAKMTAELAVDSLDFVGQLAETGGRESAVDYLKGASHRYTKARASIGSQAHNAFEALIRGEDPGTIGVDIRGHVAHFREFLDVVQPELVSAEEVAWSDTHTYAGSYDGVLRIKVNPETLELDPRGDSALVMADWKTGKATYPDVALQMSAYGNADRIIDPEGNSRPMPDLDGAAVLHVTDKEWSFKPVLADESVFKYFLALRQVFDWDRDVSRTVLGKPLAKSGKFVSGTERRGR